MEAAGGGPRQPFANMDFVSAVWLPHLTAVRRVYRFGEVAGWRGSTFAERLRCVRVARGETVGTGWVRPNVLPLAALPEGAIVCNVEEQFGDRGSLARTLGNYATVIRHDADSGRTRIRLPSGAKKSVNALARATIGIVAGGGRIEQAHARGWTRLSPGQGQEEQLAQDPWCRHKPRQPPPPRYVIHPSISPKRLK